MKIIKKRIVFFLVFGAITLTGCQDAGGAAVIKNKNVTSTNEKTKYIETKCEGSASSNLSQLDVISDSAIGMLKSPKGQLEWYNMSQSVKKEYRSKARVYLKENKVLPNTWLENRVWCFTLDQDNKWNRMEVVPDYGIADVSSKFSGAKAFYGADEKLYIVMQYVNVLKVNKVEVNFIIYSKEDNKWKQYSAIKYKSQKDYAVYLSKDYYINANGEFILMQRDGTISKYDLRTGTMEKMDIKDKLDLHSAVFSEGMMYAFNSQSNQVKVMDDSTFTEERVLTMPEKSKLGGTVLALGKEDTLLAINRMGIFSVELGGNEDKFTKISDASVFYAVPVDNLEFETMVSDNSGNIYVNEFNTVGEKYVFACYKEVTK